MQYLQKKIQNKNAIKKEDFLNNKEYNNNREILPDDSNKIN